MVVRLLCGREYSRERALVDFRARREFYQSRQGFGCYFRLVFTHSAWRSCILRTIAFSTWLKSYLTRQQRRVFDEMCRVFVSNDCRLISTGFGRDIFRGEADHRRRERRSSALKPSMSTMFVEHISRKVVLLRCFQPSRTRYALDLCEIASVTRLSYAKFLYLFKPRRRRCLPLRSPSRGDGCE